MIHESTEAGDRLILNMLADLDRRLRQLEEVNDCKTPASIPIPPRAWMDGAAFRDRGKVHAESTPDPDGMHTRIRGSISGPFGFIHHPQVHVRTGSSELLITAFSCDCEDFSDGNFCSHCAALIHNEFGGQPARLLPGSAASGAAEPLSNIQNGIHSIDILTDTRDHQGFRTINGKALCNFNFIHRPTLTLSSTGEVSSYSCTCALSNDRMCPHCLALKHSIPTSDCPSPVSSTDADSLHASIDELYGLFAEEAVPTDESEEADAAAAPTADENTHLMKIRFGTDTTTDRPVYWFPNNTSQITHINTGIIGTMGTGKTQFTKSMITQLCRQKEQNLHSGSDLGILIFDYKGDYNENNPDFVKAAGARVLKLHKLPFNPFSLMGFKRKPQLHVHTAMAFADTLTQIYGLGAIQKNTLVQTILAAYKNCGITDDPFTWNTPAPTFAQVYETYLSRGKTQRSDSLAVALDTLAFLQVFEPDPAKTVSLFELLRHPVVIDLTGHTESVQHLVVAITLELFYAQMLNAPHSKLVTTPEGDVYRQLRQVILVDEADNIMERGIPVLKNIIKEGREFGIGVILSTQFLDHFHTEKEDYRKYMKTWVVHNVESLKKADLEYVFQIPAQDPIADQLYQDIKHLEKHHSVIRIGTADPIYTKDLAFYQISGDENESYLDSPDKEETEHD